MGAPVESSTLATTTGCLGSDISTFSFHPLKSITTGEGGALTTNSKKIYDKLVVLRTIGIKRSNNHFIYVI